VADNLTPDPVAVELGTGGPDTLGYVTFKGFLTGGSESGTSRLFLFDTFRMWLELRTSDIKHKLDIPPNPSDPRSLIWVDEDAIVVKCQVGRAHDIADDVDVWGAAPGTAEYGPNRPRRPPY
jgi:hypothetical protein